MQNAIKVKYILFHMEHLPYCCILNTTGCITQL